MGIPNIEADQCCKKSSKQEFGTSETEGNARQGLRLHRSTASRAFSGAALTAFLLLICAATQLRVASAQNSSRPSETSPATWPEDAASGASIYTDDPSNHDVLRRRSYCLRQQEVLAGVRTMKDALWGVELSVVLTPRPGWVDVNEAGEVTGGFHVNLLDELASRAGFSWRNSFAVVPNPDTAADPNGWTTFLIWGVKNYDLVAEYFIVTPGRRKLGVTFHSQIFDNSLIIITEKLTSGAELTVAGLFSFLDPFAPEVWAMLLGFMFLTGVFYKLVDGYNEIDFPHRSGLTQLKWFRHSVYLAASMFTGGDRMTPMSTLGRVVKFSWSFTMMLIGLSYTAQLASALIIRAEAQFKINTITEASGRKICVWAGTATAGHLSSVYKAIELVNLPSNNEMFDQMTQQLCDGGVLGLFEWLELQRYDNSRHCDIVEVPGSSFKEWDASWGIRSDAGLLCSSLVSDVLSLHLQEMDDEDVLQAIRLTYLDSLGTACPPQGSQKEESKVSILDLGGIFMTHLVVCLGCVFARHAIGRGKMICGRQEYEHPHHPDYVEGEDQQQSAIESKLMGEVGYANLSNGYSAQYMGHEYMGHMAGSAGSKEALRIRLEHQCKEMLGLLNSEIWHRPEAPMIINGHLGMNGSPLSSPLGMNGGPSGMNGSPVGMNGAPPGMNGMNGGEATVFRSSPMHHVSNLTRAAASTSDRRKGKDPSHIKKMKYDRSQDYGGGADLT